MASFPEFVRFCAARSGCDKGGLYAIQPRGLRGSPIKIGYSFDLLRRLAAWEYSYPSGIDILAVARMNRPNDTHFHKRRALQLAEALLKHELREHVLAREEWLQPWAKAEMLAAMRRLQLSLSPNLALGARVGALRHARSARAAECCAHDAASTKGAASTGGLALPPSAQGRGAEVRGGCSVPLGALAAWARQVRGEQACWRPDKLTAARADCAQHARPTTAGTSMLPADEHGPRCK